MNALKASPKRIDHLVLAVRDLDAVAERYRALGFQVGGRNRHPWGTENRIVQFHSSFLELITVGDESLIEEHRPGHFSFGAFVRDYLARREGLAMLVLDSEDARHDAHRFAKRGIGAFEPFFFERKGRRPDGSETHVAFTLAFAHDPAVPDASFFVCQQHFPDAFWNTAFQQHANGARNVTEVTVQASDPGHHAAFLQAFADGAFVPQDAVLPLQKQGRIAISPDAGAGGLVAFTLLVDDLAAVSALLGKEGIEYSIGQGRITIPAHAWFGVDLQFEMSR
ncbi:VOC family protein [Rhizobium sp. SSA_523]|uniref:VOC family protein n=1 Tax=Rhizobium sp. SSA_523 TaxID=2952477 RepID=UPI002090B939|nr:VOC family protein [Rhizobium sp. SSA_523]MCO5734279.1 VOC family protein [Rhizobium sp. SSA_523]WKC21449.1 VOC family protein [Rhizobium sp. SSA_523]